MFRYEKGKRRGNAKKTAREGREREGDVDVAAVI